MVEAVVGVRSGDVIPEWEAVEEVLDTFGPRSLLLETECIDALVGDMPGAPEEGKS